MSFISLLAVLVVVASLVHLTRFWPRPAFLVILAGGAALTLGALNVTTSSLDVFGVTLGLEPSTRDYLAVAFGLTTALALAAILMRDRSGLSFLYWTWPSWVVALAVGDFVVAVFAWALGLITAVFAMRPRKRRRASGAAYFLAFVVIGMVCLLLANRFIALYPLTPERPLLIQFAVLFLALGMGLVLAVFPFQIWVGPMTDDAPLPVSAAVLGLGQPIGLWLLIRLLSQYPWVLDKSNFLDLLALGGATAILAGGILAGVERRGGRLLGYAAIFSFGFALVNLSKANREGLAFGGMELVYRAVALTLLAAAITVAQNVNSLAVRRTALIGFLAGGLSLVGLRLGASMASRWNLLVDWAGADQRLLWLVLVAHTGLLVGVVRFSRHWLSEQVPADRPEGQAVPAQDVTVEPEPVGLPAFALPSAVVEQAGGPRPLTAQSAVARGAEQELSAVRPPERDHGGAEAGEADEGNRSDTGGEAAGTLPEEYVFEEHVREIIQTLAARWGPQLQRVARSLPGRTQGSVLLVWRSYKSWMGIGLLALLITLLVLMSLDPGILFNRMFEAFGTPPFVQ